METEYPIQKKTMGRRRIEIKKIENKNYLQVAFSKRRAGLFRKAAQLSILCGVDVAIIIESPNNKLYTFGNRSVESVLNRFEEGIGLVPSWPSLNLQARIQNHESSKMRCLEVEKKLEGEKMMESARQNPNVNQGFWWDQCVDDTELHELEEYQQSLEKLRSNVLNLVEEMEKERISNSVSGFGSTSSNLLMIPSGSIEDFSSYGSILDGGLEEDFILPHDDDDVILENLESLFREYGHIDVLIIFLFLTRT